MVVTIIHDATLNSKTNSERNDGSFSFNEFTLDEMPTGAKIIRISSDYPPPPIVVDQKLISAAIWILSLILVPMALTNALEGDFMLMGVLGGLSGLLFIFFVLKEGTCALPIIGLYFAGRLNFLPFGLTAPSIFTLGLVIYVFFEYFALKQRNVSPGPPILYIPILIITVIVGYHNRQVGLHALGSSAEGSRQGLMMMLGPLAYICGSSVFPPSVTFLSRIPWYCLLLGIITSIPNLLTSFFPGLAPYLYYLTDNVNLDAYRESLGYDTDIVRGGGFGSIGMYLELFLIAYYPIYSWWRPHRWWVSILFLISFVGVIEGGFRSSMALYGFIFLVGTWCYCSWRSLFLLPVACLVVFTVSVCAQSGLVDLPLSMQRSLSFLPGRWDAVVLESTAGSNDFRQNIEQVYKREYLYKSPWVGNGFLFDTREADMLTDMSRYGDTGDHYFTAKAFIVSKTYHVGWISLYDTVGLIGGIAFVALGVSMIWMSSRAVWGRIDYQAPLFPLKVWLLCNITREFVGYFTVFGDIRNSFPAACAYAIILIHLYRVERGMNLNPAAAPLPQPEAMQPPGKRMPQPSFLRPT